VVTTALHAALSRDLGLRSITIASSDEAYSGGPISIQSRIDTLRATAEAFRFFGEGGIWPTEMAERYQEQIRAGTLDVLAQVARRGDFIASLREGLLGSREEGASPGGGGKDTVRRKEA
jgi:glutamate mutase epsilon subunit